MVFNYLSEFHKQLVEFLLLHIVVVEIVQDRCSNSLMQDLPTKNTTNIQQNSTHWFQKLDIIIIHTSRKAPMELLKTNSRLPRPFNAIALATRCKIYTPNNKSQNATLKLRNNEKLMNNIFSPQLLGNSTLYEIRNCE